MRKILKIDNVYIFINILFLLFSIFEKNIMALMLVILFQFCTQIIYIYTKKQNILHLSIIFIGITFIFNIGRIFLEIFFNYKDDLMPQFVVWFGKNTVQKSLAFYILINVLFSMGMLIAFNSKRRDVSLKKTKLYLSCSQKEFKMIGIILFVIGFGPKIWIDVQRLVISLTSSYLATYDINLAGVGGLSTFYYLGVMILIVSCAGKKQFVHFFIGIVALWELISIFSGKRYDAIAFYIILIYLYITFYKGSVDIKKLNYKKVGLIVIALIFVIMVINTMRYTRVNTITLSAIVEGFMLQLKNNPIVEILAEMGNSFLTLVLTVDRVPNLVEYGYGVSYYGTVVSVLPFLDGIMQNIVLEFIKVLQFEWAMGGNWIAEAYYNLGIFGGFIGFCWGWCLIKIDDQLHETDAYLMKLFILTFVFQIIKYTREYFTLFRISAIQILFVICLLVFIKMLNKKGVLDKFEIFLNNKIKGRKR